MDKRADDGGRLTPIEQIKANHNTIRYMILNGGIDEIPWQAAMLPEQAGLMQVFADQKGHLWKMQRTEKGLKHVRIWHLS